MGLIRIREDITDTNYRNWYNGLRAKGYEYRNGLAFLDELFETYTDVVEADMEYERKEAMERFYALHHSIKRYATEGVLYAFRSGLNIHCEFHSFPYPVMLVWFEDTGQKRIIPSKSKHRAVTAEDGVYVPGAKPHQEYGVLDGGVLRTTYSGYDMYFQLQGQEYVYTPHIHFQYGELFKLLSRSYFNDGFETLVFNYGTLKKSGIEIPCEYFVDQTPFMDIEFSSSTSCGFCYAPSSSPGAAYNFTLLWFKEWFFPWYIKTFAEKIQRTTI